MTFKTVTALVALILFGLTPAARAASLDLVPTTAIEGVVPGDLVAFDIVLDFFGEPTIGGGFDLSYDPAQLELVSFTDTVILGNADFGRPPDFLYPGLLASWAVGDLGGLSVGLIGVVVFRVSAGATASVVQLEAVSGGGASWLSLADLVTVIEPAYGSQTVTARVPMPAAVWLMLSALAGLWAHRYF